LILGACLVLSAAYPVSADTPTPTAEKGLTATPSPTPTVTPPCEGCENVAPAGADLRWLVFLALGFALAALVSVLVYINAIQGKYYRAATTLGESGVPVKTVSVPTWTGQAALEAVAKPLPKIEGPATIVTGVESGEFSVTLDGKPLDKAIWTVEPPNVAIVIPPSGGARVKIIAAIAGVIKLYAEASDKTTEKASISVAVVAPQPAPVELPFVGREYGSVILGIILVAAVILLGLAQVLSGEGVATLLGSLLGYIFGAAVVAKSK
jgi:hypothetical protein